MPSSRLIRTMLIVTSCIVMLQTAEAQRRPRIISPEVKSDKTVTFRFHAPQAHQVLVSVEYLEGLRPLRLGEDGVWSITLGPFEPELACALGPESGLLSFLVGLPVVFFLPFELSIKIILTARLNCVFQGIYIRR